MKVKKSKYIDVFFKKNWRKDSWLTTYGGYFEFTEEGERMAAKSVDLERIKRGLEPVNILKRKDDKQSI
jgi:hypothetical protein